MWRSLVLVALVLLASGPTLPAPPTGHPDGCLLTGTVTRHGFPASARVEVRRLRALEPGIPRRLVPEFPHLALREPPTPSGPPLVTTTTDENGNFEVPGLPLGHYLVRAADPSGAETATVELTLPGMREHLRLVLRFQETSRWTGRARWSDDSPFRGTVAVGEWGVVTDEEGRFDLAGAFGDETRIIVWEEGRIARALPLPDAAPEGGLVLTVDEGLAPLVGYVGSADGPARLMGATVTAVTVEEGGGFAVTGGITGPEGDYRVLGRTGTRLHVRAAGRLDVEIEHPGEDRPLLIGLPAAPTVTGRVVSAGDGRPLPGLPVFLMELVHDTIETGRFATPAGAWSETDGRGRFEIVSPVAGNVMVFVYGRGFLTPGLEEATSGGYNPAALRLAPGERAEVEVLAAPSPTLAGRLTDPGGNPVPGVYVTAESGTGGRPAHQWRMGWFDDLSQTVTGSDGSFRLPSLLPGLTWTVSAWPVDRPGTVSEPVTPEGSEEVRVDLTLPTPAPDRYVTVTVVSSPGGGPVAGAGVTVSGAREEEDEDGWPLPYEAEDELHGERTGPDGKARLGPFSRRPLVVDVAHSGFAPVGGLPLPGTEGDESELSLTVPLDRGKAIAGRALLPDGTPARGARVILGKPGARVNYDRGFRTDTEGRFEVGGLAEGTYEVRVQAVSEDGTSFSGEALAETGTEDVVVALEIYGGMPFGRGPRTRPEREGPELLVRVLGPEGALVPEGVVLTRTLNEYGKERSMVARGDHVPFTAGQARLVFGEYDAAVWLDVRTPPGSPLGPALAGPFSVQDSPVTISLSPATRIAGVVLGPDRSRVRGVRVFAVPVNAGLAEREELPDHHGAAWADPSGRFHIEGLGEGAYDLFASGPSSLRSEGPVRVAAGSESAEVLLLRADRVEITVLDGEGEPVFEAEVHVHLRGAERPLFAHDAVADGTTNERGVVLLGGLDREEEFTLVVEPGWDREDLGELEVDPWNPANGTFRLTGVREVLGKLMDTDGFPMSWATLWWLLEDGGDDELHVDGDGSFDLQDVPPGPVKLLVGPFNSERDDSGLTEVVISGEDAVSRIELDPGPAVTVRVEGWPEDAPAETHWYWSVKGTSSYPHWPLRADGRQRLHSSPPGGKYCFHVALSDGRMAHAMDLEPSAEDHVLALRPGKSIRGSLVLPKGAHDVELSLWGPNMRFDLEVAPGGAFEVVGLPDGDYSLFAQARSGRTKYRGKVRTEPGVEVEILLAEE